MSRLHSFFAVYKGLQNPSVTHSFTKHLFPHPQLHPKHRTKIAYQMFKTLLSLALGAFLISFAAASPLESRYTSSSSTTPLPASTPFTASPAEIKAIQEALILAPSEIDRENILFTNPPDATNITFQFVNVTHRAPTGGEIVLSSVDNFPALIGTHGISPFLSSYSL